MVYPEYFCYVNNVLLPGNFCSVVLKQTVLVSRNTGSRRHHDAVHSPILTFKYNWVI